MSLFKLQLRDNFCAHYCRVTQYIRILKRVLSQNEKPFRTETL